MDANDIWNDYSSTKLFLTTTSKTGILCKPMFKVIEDNLIVGILTETNQFVMIDRPTENIYNDELKIINDNNHIMVDGEISTNTTKDIERELFIKKIKLETNFYNVFRITIKLLLNDPNNYKYREQITQIINNDEILYTEKLTSLINLLKDLTKFNVKFAEGYDDTIIEILDEISICYNKENCDDNKFCLTDNKNCMIVIPKKHLINDVDNEKIYYGRVSDELLRYKFIRDFLLKPQVYLSLNKIDYNLKENEIILLDTLLTQEYFEKLIPKKINYYMKNNVFDDIQPNVSIRYDNNMNLVKELDQSNDCIIKVTPKVRGRWAKVFAKNSVELVYNKSEICTYQLIIDIVKDFKKMDILVNDIKLVLIEEYKKYSLSQIKIDLILEEQGKSGLLKLSLRNSNTLEDLIMSDHYYLTNLDLWILAEYYQLPIIILSSTKLTENKRPILIMNDMNINSFYFIRQPSIQINKIPSYSLIKTADNLLIDVKLGKPMLKANIDSEKLFAEKDYPNSEAWIENKTTFRIKVLKTKKK